MLNTSASGELRQKERVKTPQIKSDPQGNSQYIKTTVVCPYYISTGMFSGVSSKIIPILEPDFVATSVVDATLANKEIVLLPWWTTFLFMLKVGVCHVLLTFESLAVDIESG